MDGDVGEAARRLAVAVESLDRLGQDDRYSQSVRQTYREARALQVIDLVGLTPVLLAGVAVAVLLAVFVDLSEADRPVRAGSG